MEPGPPPPWQLLSPGGIWIVVPNEDALDALADSQIPRVPRANFRQLVGLNKNSSSKLPQHKALWQLRQKVPWIERAAGHFGAAVAPQPLAGASGKEWVTQFKDVHLDADLDGARLHTLAFSGKLWSNGEKVYEYRGWRKVSDPMACQVCMFRAFRDSCGGDS